MTRRPAANVEPVLYSSAQEIPRSDWSALSSGGDARLHPAWFVVMERAIPDVERLYLGLRENGNVRAVAPCLFGTEDDSGFASYRSTDVLLRPEEVRGPDVPGLEREELRRAASQLHELRPLRTLTVVVPFSRYADICPLLSPDPEAFERLVAQLDSLALERKAVLWAILGVADTAALLMHARRLGLRAALLSADTMLHVPWSSFEGYVAALPSGRRTMVRKELRAGKERYTIAAEPDVQAIVWDLSRLVKSHRARYGVQGARPMVLDELARVFGKDASLLGARSGGKLIAYTLLLRQGDVVQVFGYGADHAVRERQDFLWQNMAMYAPIADVVARGGGTLRWGPTNYEAKLLRGSELEPMWGLYRPLDTSLEAALDVYIEPFNRLQKAHYEALSRYSVSRSTAIRHPMRGCAGVSILAGGARASPHPRR